MLVVKENSNNENIRVALDTLGCKLNQAETELMAGQFAAAGCRLVSPDDEADIYVLNTCTVTHIADRKSRHRLRLARRRSPGAVIVAAGCYAQRAAEELSRIDGVSLVVGNGDKMDIVPLLEASGYLENKSGLPAEQHNGLRSRSFIRVQDGCSNRCAYCIVPLVRASQRSLPAEKVIAEIGDRVAGGYREAVLTGTEIGSYSYNGLDLSRLTEAILSETGIMRLRLSSLQPHQLTPALIELWRSPRLCSHLHLCLQSGSGSVLERMGRRYSTRDYKEAVALIRRVVPDAAITTDVMVGFPGESDREFEDSYGFCQEMGFARIHVFPFSPRLGTEAAGMKGQVSARVKRERSRKMLALAEESSQSFRKQFLGRTMPVLWEQKSNGLWSGLTGNYIRVYTKSSDDLTNRITDVKLDRLFRDGVVGDL